VWGKRENRRQPHAAEAKTMKVISFAIITCGLNVRGTARSNAQSADERPLVEALSSKPCKRTNAPRNER
jgi:hypothetical protein